MSYAFVGTYRARCTKVVDGDTIDVVVDLGFHLTATMRLRLWGVNTPEMHAKDLDDRVRARAASQYVSDRLRPGESEEWTLQIVTLKDPDAFGRWLAKVYYADSQVSLNEQLISDGHAVEYVR